MPTILPAMAPNARLGINNPHGTLIPNVNTVMTSFKIRASSSSHIAW